METQNQRWDFAKLIEAALQGEPGKSTSAAHICHNEPDAQLSRVPRNATKNLDERQPGSTAAAMLRVNSLSHQAFSKVDKKIALALVFSAPEARNDS